MAFERTATLYPDFNSLVPGENPLSDSGRWTHYFTRPPLKVRDSGGFIHGTVEGVVNGSLYVGQAFIEDTIEVYGCMPFSGLGAALESNRIALWTDPANLVGYSWGWGGGISENFFLRKYTGGGGFIGIGGAYASAAYAPQIGIRITPTTVEGWANYSGVWTLITTASGETSYRGTFYASLETEEQGGIEEVAWTCFGVGAINRTQIYRIIRG